MRYFHASCDYAELADIYGTPLYVYDFDSMQKQYGYIKDSFSGFKSLVCYALKANSNLSVINTLAKLGSGADCVSLNEIKRAMLAGIPSYKIIFSGVGKEDYEIREALQLGILFLNIESEMELIRIEDIARELSSQNHVIEARISLRVNPDVDAKTHPYISTGLHENKFGLDMQTAKRLYLYAHKSPYLNPIGIHYHIGSQILESAPLLEATHKVLSLAKSLLSANIGLKFFDLGGGFGISYNDEKPFDIKDYISHIIRHIDSLDLTAICEPGRSIVGNSGAILTRVIGEKNTNDKRFVIIDCAMNDLLRPSLYNAYHHVSYLGSPIIDSSLDSCMQVCDIVGAICESGDYIAKDRALPLCKSGDLLLIESSGAYGYSMASNYNSRLKPAEVAISNGRHFLIKQRENFEDSVKGELELLRSQM
ncbi:diaminopimelate decarboxylase [Helicobacter muridarum]|uniref:Diaminopimelate decarboxylase n=1 Tax=Helicobacter muridarum TaxID=216 RepID=A0A099TXV8_9HELI|nr:diaminopimelate decarboxylase [Helicobacter muridarum]TLD98403.1 diaminopimelate decarboxylase [Helicobacter muridarum]STQ86172.1 diaminopimelate decarboxylase [Helicobacter muridarum]